MLDRGKAKPLYRQLEERLLAELALGTRPVHSQLPSERQWVQELGVSRITVRQALNDLVQQGYLYTVPGKGFFVAETPAARELNAFLSFTAATRARGETPSSRVLQAKIVRAPSAVARDLRIAPGAEVVMLTRVRLAEGIAVMIQKSVLPHARCPGLLERDLTTMSLFATLRESYRVALARAETTITARPADRAAQRLLGLPHPGVVLVADQLTLDEDGLPVERAESLLHPERHPLSLVQDNIGRSLGVS